MPHTISWAKENHIINIHVVGEVDVEFITNMSLDIIEYIEMSDSQLVHLLIDETDMEGFPRQVKDILSSSDFLRHPRLGWFIIYGSDNKFMNFISHMVTQVLKIRHRRVPTREDALEFVLSVDESIPASG